MSENAFMKEPTMRLATVLACISGVVLALFILIRPVVGRIGSPTAPDIGGLPPGPGPSGSTIDTSLDSFTKRPLPGRNGVVSLASVEDLIFAMTNQERQLAGLSPLIAEGTLRDIASEHSTDMIARAFFNNDNPDGRSTADRIALHHRQFIGGVGENIASIVNADSSMSDQEVAQRFMTIWMNSPGHRANILGSEFTHLGVGVSRKGNDILATQDFADVQIYLDQPVPVEVYRGERLPLTFSSSGPDLYDYWSSEKGLSVGSVLSIDSLTVNAPPGVYKLRFYFPVAGRHLISMGPWVEVKSR